MTEEDQTPKQTRTHAQEQALQMLLDDLGVDITRLQRWAPGEATITIDWVYERLYRWACEEFRRRLFIDYPGMDRAMQRLAPLDIPSTKDDEVRYDLIERQLMRKKTYGIASCSEIVPTFRLEGTITGRIPRDDRKFEELRGGFRDPALFFGHKEEIQEEVIATAGPGPVSIVPPEIGEHAKQEYLRSQREKLQIEGGEIEQ